MRLLEIVSVTAFILISSSTSLCSARSWYVEKDGSGEFATIQAAVDVAASGDTIRIGPGQYDDGQIVTCPGWTDFVRILVTPEVLTFIGSGDETVVGPIDPWEYSDGANRGLVASSYFGNQSVCVKDIVFRNLGIAWRSSSVNVQVENCLFEDNYRSTDFFGGDELIVRNTRFHYLAYNEYHTIVHTFSDFIIENCEYRCLDTHPLGNTVCLAIENCLEGRVEDCHFVEGSIGLQANQTILTSVKSCTFEGQSVVGAIIVNGAMEMEHCQITDQYRFTKLSQFGSNLRMRNCSIENVQDCSFLINYVGSLSVQECDLAKGDRGVIYVGDRQSSVTPEHLEMINNYWGTDEPDSIAAWIYDARDGSENNPYIIDFQPFYSESTPVETKSLSDLKSLFR